MDDSFDDALASVDVEGISKSVSDTKQEQPGTSDASTSKTVKKLSSSFGLLVNKKQKGNPLLKAVTNVTWEFDDIIPDYQMGQTTCALFLSLKYHNLNPDYIHERLKLLGKMYQLRVLLVLIDIDDPHQPLKHLSRICILADLTLMLAWSFEEAGKILETYKIYENKPADVLMEKSESYPYLKLIQALTAVKPVNKTDAMTLLGRFGTLKNIIEASEYQLSQCPGLGPRKAKRLYQVLHENFCRE
ncbi:Ercc1 [Carabus blaptoides fortunei]